MRSGGHLLVDCGAGKEYWMRKFAHEFHVGLLFEIDVAYQRPKMIASGSPPIRILFQKGDMLDALSRLPSACGNISINGIDGTLIENQEYHKALAHEIERVLQPGGIVFGFQSDVRRYIETSLVLTSLRLNSVRSAYIEYFVCKKQPNH